MPNDKAATDWDNAATAVSYLHELVENYRVNNLARAQAELAGLGCYDAMMIASAIKALAETVYHSNKGVETAILRLK